MSHRSSALRREEASFNPIFQPEELDAQITALVQCFPSLDPDPAHDYLRTRLPTHSHFGADGWFAVPRRSAISDDYVVAVMKVMAKLNEHPYTCHSWGNENYRHLRAKHDTIEALEMIGESQRGDILIIPAQLGHFHAGRSVEQVRKEYLPKEFGLGAFEVGCMFLANPHRLVLETHLFVDCPGDAYNAGPGPDSYSAPSYSIDSDHSMEFLARFIDQANPEYGSATGFAL